MNTTTTKAEELFNSHINTAYTTVNKFLKDPKYVARKSNMQLEDIQQMALIGLFKAAQLFDETKGRSFRNFAITYIRWEISTGLRKESQWITGYTKEAEEYRKSNWPISIDSKPILDDEDSCTYHELIGSDYNLEEHAIGEVMSEKIKSLIPPRTLEFLELRTQGATLREIGDKYGITHQCVNLHIKKAEKKLERLRQMKKVI